MSNLTDELKRKRDVINESKVDRRVGVYFLRAAEDSLQQRTSGRSHEYATHLPGVQIVRTLTIKAALDPEVLAASFARKS